MEIGIPKEIGISPDRVTQLGPYAVQWNQPKSGCAGKYLEFERIERRILVYSNLGVNSNPFLTVSTVGGAALNLYSLIQSIIKNKPIPGAYGLGLIFFAIGVLSDLWYTGDYTNPLIKYIEF